jgi:PiT family inorganic phosphate transporter
MGVATAALEPLEGETFGSARQFRQALDERTELSTEDAVKVLINAEIDELYLDPAAFRRLDSSWLTADQLQAIRRLSHRRFLHRWSLAEALAELSPDWVKAENIQKNKLYNKELGRRLDAVYRIFRVKR